jgi:predicted transcriptional regulator
MAISNQPLKELLPLSIFSTPAVSIQQENKVWVAAGMLVHYLESFTDSLVVTNKEYKPIGVMGGIEIIKQVFENPSSDLFEKSVGDIMDEELIQISPETKLVELIEKWKQTRRAFCILPNHYSGYSAISARKLLEIGAYCKTDLTVADLPKKKIVTFNCDDTMGKIINLMLENKTRKLVFKNTAGFISDRIIIQTIAQDLNYLRGVENFLDHKFEVPFKLADIKSIPQDLNLTDLSKLMFGMMHPYVMSKDQVYSPWDVCMALLSENMEYKNEIPNYIT